MSFFFLLCFSHSVFADPIADRINAADNPYQILGVSSSAPPEEVKRAYMNIVKKYYPASNQGDEEATKIMQKVNAARDRITKTPISNPRSYSGGGSSGGASEIWESFYEKMRRAPTAAERTKLRNEQMQHVKSAADFTRVATGGESSFLSEVGLKADAKDFAVKNMGRFMMYDPSLPELNQLARAGADDPGAQKEVYAAAFREAKRPGQILNFMKPELSGNKGGPNWIQDFQDTTRSELYRFFKLNPSADETKRMQSMTNIVFRKGEGHSIFSESIAKYKHVMDGNTPESFRAGFFSGSVGKLMKGFAGKFFAVDPSLVVGAVKGHLESQEAESLMDLSCPKSLLSTPRLVSAAYLQIFVMRDREEQDKILQSCEKQDRGAADKLQKASLSTLQENRDSLQVDPKSLNCSSSGLVEFISKNGLRSEIKFDGEGKPVSIRTSPPKGKGNPNHELKFNFGQSGRAFEYSAFDYPANKEIDSKASVIENETSFFLRMTCLREICSNEGFNSGVTENDESMFSLDFKTGGTPADYKNPFGDMKTDFIEKSGHQTHRLISLLRSQKSDHQKNLCEALQSSGELKPLSSAEKNEPPGARQ